ncbi:MAG: hypothetical protein Q9199_001849 [Rusavskia elegans]
MATDRAFNYKGVAYEHGIEDRQEFTCLRVRNLSSSNITETASFTIPSLTPTVEELDLDSERALIVVWIGMGPTTEIQKTGMKGVAIAANKQPRVLPADPKALRVVVAMATKETMIQS